MFNSLFASKLNPKQHGNSASVQDELRDTSDLHVETLEDRFMLSTVSVFAAGDTGTEAFDLRVNDVTVATFENVGGNTETREFIQFDFETDAQLTADDIRVEFLNDTFDAETGFDRNLLVDGIIIDGVAFETENSAVFSTGLFRDGGLTGPGNLETELLNINGSFFFSNDGASNPVVNSGTRIRVDAAGAEGGEIIAVDVNGNQVQTFELSQTTESFFVTIDQEVSVTDVEIRFINDEFDSEAGIDRNAIINNVQTIDLETGFREVVRLATNESVFSTGTYLEADGIVAGFGRGDTLHANGFFRFDASDNVESDNPGNGGDTDGLRLQLNEEVFDLENTGLAFEDFEGFPTDIPDSFNRNITTPLNNETDNLIVQPGDIVEGVTFQAEPQSQFRILNTDEQISQFRSDVLGTPSSQEFTIDFDPGVQRIGFDLYAVDNGASNTFFRSGETVTSNTNATIEVFGNSGLIDELLVSAPQPDGFNVIPVFIGLESNEDITGIRILQRFTEPNPIFATGASFAVDNVRFG